MAVEPPSGMEKQFREKPALNIEQIGQIAKFSEKYLQCNTTEFSEDELLSNLRALFKLSMQNDNQMSRSHARQINKLAIAAASFFGSKNLSTSHKESEGSHNAEPKNRINRFTQGMKEGIIAISAKASGKKQEKPAVDELKAVFYRQKADFYAEKGKFNKAGKNYEVAADFAPDYEKIQLYYEAEESYKKAGRGEHAVKMHNSLLETAFKVEQQLSKSIQSLHTFELFTQLSVGWQLTSHLNSIKNELLSKARHFDGALSYSRILVKNEHKLNKYISFRSLLSSILPSTELSKFEKESKSLPAYDLQSMRDEISSLKDWKLKALEELHNAYSADDQGKIEAIVNEINAKNKTGLKQMYAAIGAHYDGYVYTDIYPSMIGKGSIRSDRDFLDSPVDPRHGTLTLEQYAGRLGKIMKTGFKTSGRALRHGILGVSYIHNLLCSFEPLRHDNTQSSFNFQAQTIRWKPEGYCLLEYYGGIIGRREGIVFSPHGIKPKEMTILLKNPEKASNEMEKEWIQGLAKILGKRGIPFEYN